MNFPVPVVQGVIARRLLVNFRVRPDVLAALLPAPFQPKLVNGFGLAGICLIRLEQVRPRGLPAFVGLSSENAAHRIAVEWAADGKLSEGVFIPRHGRMVEPRARRAALSRLASSSGFQGGGRRRTGADRSLRQGRRDGGERHGSHGRVAAAGFCVPLFGRGSGVLSGRRRRLVGGEPAGLL